MSIKLKSNEFWGERSGYYDSTKNRFGLPNGFRIDISKWGNGKENGRPVGKKARGKKEYSNEKIRRKVYTQNK